MQDALWKKKKKEEEKKQQVFVRLKHDSRGSICFVRIATDLVSKWGSQMRSVAIRVWNSCVSCSQVSDFRSRHQNWAFQKNDCVLNTVYII